MSTFGDRFEESAVPRLKAYLGDLADYYPVVTGISQVLTVVFNEFVGAIDEKSRAIFTIASADVSSPRRGDRFVITGGQFATEQWTVIDIRGDESGTYELRCDRSLEDV